MTPKAALLRPVNPAFITFSLTVALLLDLLPWGQAPWIPDFVALALVFWNIHTPRRVGIGIAWLMGVLIDVHNASVLGEHALAYSLLSYGAISLHRRVPWFGVAGQALHILPLMVGTQIIIILVRVLTGADFPGFGPLWQALSNTLLWPLAHWLLLAPQRRRVDEDEAASL